MAPLPRPRLQSLRAFERVGVDYGGPFLTKQGRGKATAIPMPIHLSSNKGCSP